METPQTRLQSIFPPSFLLVPSVTALFSVAGCTRLDVAPPAPPPLVVAVEQREVWVRNFNPFLPLNTARWPTYGGVLEPLMIFNVVRGVFEPWLATGYEWDETDHVVVFSLRQGVRWSDGRPLTPDDVVFTFNLMRGHPEIDDAGVWGFLSEVRAQGDNSVAFVFKHAFVPGLESLAVQSIVPEHIWKDVVDPTSFTNETPVGTGPFTEVVRFEDTVYELGPNPYYWQGTLGVTGLRMPSFSSNDDVLEALLAGEVDWSGNFVSDVENTYVAQDPEHRGFWSPLIAGPIFLYANTTRAPFDEVKVRKALSMAIDRERLVRGPMQGYTRPADATGLGDAQERFRSQEEADQGTWVQYDTLAAAGELDGAGYPRGGTGARGPTGGMPWSFEIMVPKGWTDWVEASQMIAERLSAIGVPVSTTQLPQPEWFDRLRRGDFDLSIGWSYSGPSPYFFYRWLMSTASVLPLGRPAQNNWHRFGHPEADVLLEAIELTHDEDIQGELFRQLQGKFVELAPALPLFPGPSWGTFNSLRYEGFPTEDDPYVRLSPNHQPECLLVLTKLKPRLR